MKSIDSDNLKVDNSDMRLLTTMKLVQTQFYFYKTHKTRRNGSSVHKLTKEYIGVPFIRISCVKVVEIVL